MRLGYGVLPIVVGNPQRGLGLAVADWPTFRSSLTEIAAVTLKRDSWEWECRVDEATFVARFGRRPLESEMGCAAVHVEAYKTFLSTSFSWALVFEDDALIVDEEDLRLKVSSLVNHVEPTGRVISLFTEGPIFPISSIVCGQLEVLNLRVPPQGAVAYLVDRAAASKLVATQNPISSVADWPTTSRLVDFDFVPNMPIEHATSMTTSTVAPDLDRSHLVPVTVRLLMWSGLWYLAHRKKFLNWSDYVERVLRPRLLRKLRQSHVSSAV